LQGKETSESIPIPARAAPAKHLNHGSFEYPLRRRFFMSSDESTDAFSAGKTDVAHVLMCYFFMLLLYSW
jgi:hypothetical protein